ncbi:MAG: VanZ family protein [Bacteroidetes bacterium]|nr:VanZ family protein [Bacteroidota bacterium]
MKSYLKYNWPSILWAAFILVICLMSHRHVPRVTIPYFDKVVHFTLYFILAVLTWYGWTRQKNFPALRANTFIKVILVLTLYGLTIEIMQGTLTPDRSFDLWDELANTTGATAGVWLAKALLKIR